GNYSKIESYELSVNDFVIASFPTLAEANAFAAKKADGQQTTEKRPNGLFRANIQVGTAKIPLLEMATEDDAAFNGSSIAQDTQWNVRKTIRGKYEVIAHSETPLVIGTYPNRATANNVRDHQIIVPASTRIKTNGTGVMQDPNFLL